MDSDRAKATTELRSLPDDVMARLIALEDEHMDKVWIVPTVPRGGSTYYDPNDVYALKLAQKANLDAAYLIPSNERRYIEEFAAGWALELALAIAQNLTVDMATSIGTYLLERAKLAIQVGLHNGPAENVPIRFSLAEYERAADGAVRLNNLQIEGEAAAVAETVRALVSVPENKPQDQVAAED